MDDFFCNVFLSTALKSLLNINIFPAVTLLTRIIIASQQRSGIEGSILAKAYPPLEHHFPKRGYALFYIFSYSSHLSCHGSHFCPLIMRSKCQNHLRLRCTPVDHVDQEPHHPYHPTHLPASYPSLKSDMILGDPLQHGVST